jgi:hypothetical protein
MNITAAHRARWSRFPIIGCVACRKDGRHNSGTQVHHLNIGGKAGQKRRGHADTIPLCPWHHQGIANYGLNRESMRTLFGPSLATESRAFRDYFGTDDELLSYTNELITTSDRM